MELIIAILWFLGLLMPGQTCTTADIDAMYLQHEHQIHSVMADPNASMNAVNTYNGQIHLVEEWIEEEEPILN